MIRQILFVLAAAAGLETTAQNRLLTMEEAVLKQKTTLAPAKLNQLQWIPGSSSFSYIEKREGTETLVKGKADGEGTIAVLTITKLNDYLREAGIASLKSFPALHWDSEKVISFEAEKKALRLDLGAKKITVTGSRDFGQAENIEVAPLTGFVSFNLDNNLFVYDGKEKLNVSDESDQNIISGRSVHREEFGITKGVFWSPKGDLLAFYRMDQTMVADYPIIAWADRPALNSNIKYPMAGSKSHEVTVGIYNVATGKTVFLKTGEPKEQYLTNICWSPDGQHIYMAVLNREQNHMKFNCYNVASGYLEKTLFEEHNEKYVHPRHTMMFVPGRPEQFIWQSERDGFNHLYLYDVNGKLIRQLTKGDWIITDLHGFDEKGGKAFYSSTTESPVTRNLYNVDLKTGKTQKITSGEGTHTILFNNKGFAIDNFQSITVPRESSIYNSKGKKLRVLFTAADPLADFARGQVSLFKRKSESAEDLHCRLFKPLNFDSTKKYPVIVYVYGGPNVQMINNTWNAGGDLWFQYMAERGFVVFTLDSRGSGNRGLKFEQAIFRNLAENELHDQLTGVNYLKSLPYVDQQRMGLFGWSYGGFLTTSMMTRHPGIFKVAVAGGPVIDWNYYEVMYTERYMDTPEENAAGFKKTNVLNYIDSLQGKLLIIHGAQDNVVVMQHSMRFLRSCIDKKKQVDFFVYPGHEHNVIGPDREHLYQKVTDYFTQNL
jgi:dipeptidyl-peptidase-4